MGLGFLTYAKSLEAGQNQDAHYHRNTPPQAIPGWLLSVGADSKQRPMCTAASKLAIEYY